MSDRLERVLKTIEKEAGEGRRFLPIVGPKKGLFLIVVARAITARRVLDLGTLVGYSALTLAKAIGSSGKIVSVESDAHMLEEARTNLRKANVRNVQLLHAEAGTVLRKRTDTFDLIFLDVWKESYVQLLPLCIRRLRKGGVLIADNALWDTVGMGKFRAALEKNPLLETVLVPIQDGMSFSVKR